MIFMQHNPRCHPGLEPGSTDAVHTNGHVMLLTGRSRLNAGMTVGGVA